MHHEVDRGEGLPRAEPTSFAAGLAKNAATQDVLIAAYLTLLMGAVLTATGPEREHSIRTVLLDIGFFAFGIALTRGGLLRRSSFANGLVYRLTVFLPVFLSYFQLRWILPAVSPHSLDADLLAFDLRVFGCEPSIAWDRWVTPQATEWFAFFYFGYFFLLMGHVLPIMLLARSRFRIAHFALGGGTTSWTSSRASRLRPPRRCSAIGSSGGRRRAANDTGCGPSSSASTGAGSGPMREMREEAAPRTDSC